MDPTETIDALLSAVPDLKASLDGIGDKPWSETRESMDPLDRAKMDVLLAYAINDLIWGESMLSLIKGSGGIILWDIPVFPPNSP